MDSQMAGHGLDARGTMTELPLGEQKNFNNPAPNVQNAQSTVIEAKPPTRGAADQ